MTPLLEITHLTKRFAHGQAPVVRDLSFDVRPGEIFVLLGPSGCGKTTTLRLIGGFERADQGMVKLDGRVLTGKGIHVPANRRGVGFVFQDYALFPHMTVLRNVMYGLKKLPRRERKPRASEALEAVGLAELAERKPHELSGGQQQRVAIARSLAPAPRLLLLDEPFSNLDPALRTATRTEMRKLLHQRHVTVVMVTHDQEEALSFADGIAVMNEGAIEQMGDPRDVYRQPRTSFVAQFLGRTNLIEAEGQGPVAVTPLGTMPLDREAYGRVLVSVRPEHITIRPCEYGTSFTRIVRCEFKGHDMTYQVEHQGKLYTVQTDHRCVLDPGTPVHLTPHEDAVVIEGNPA